MRIPDHESPAFWTWAIEHCDASPTQLARWFPTTSRAGWTSRKTQAGVTFDIDFPRLSTSKHLDYPDEPPEGWPERVDPPTPTVTPAPPLTSAEKIGRDKAVVKRDKRIRTLQRERDEYKGLYEQSGREGDIEDRIIAHLSEIVPALPKVTKPTFTPRTGGRPETVVMLVSDYHIGEVVSLEEMGGLAVYDWETFLKRWQYHVDAVGGICFGKLTGYDLPKLVIPMLGDMVSGLIHEELVETAEGTVMEWVCEGGHAIAQGIRQLAAEFSEVLVDCVVGNHGRLQKQVRYKKRYVSFDYLLYRFLALELRDLEHVEVRCNRSFFSLLDIPGATLLNLHGDNIKSWQGIPWYGITRAINNFSLLLQSHEKRFDIVDLGHFHNAGTLDRIGSELVLNGSAIGGNEYSLGALFTSTRPAQVLYGVHPERGKTWEFKLDLTNAETHESRLAV